MIDSGITNSVDLGLTKADIYGPKFVAKAQSASKAIVASGLIKAAKATERKPDWWELRINLKSMSEYDAMKNQPGP